MKKMRRFAAIAAAAAMTACMAVPMMSMMTASAAKITITDNGDIDASEHTFDAYQIFTGTLNSTTNPNGFTGNTVAWGSAVSADKVDEFILALQGANFTGDGVNEAMDALVAVAVEAGDGVEAKSQSTAYQVALAIEKASSADDAELLASTIDAFVKANNAEVAGTSDAGVIDELDDGYYFVKDTTDPMGKSDAYSKFILEVVGSKEVSIKTDAPKLEKKIWHNDTAATPGEIGTTAPTFATTFDGAGWSDVGDNQIGDTVYYCIATTVPDMSDYDTYSYVISDMFSAGLTFKEVTDIVYVPKGGTGKKLSVSATAGDYTGTKNDTESFYVDFGDLKAVLKAANITWTDGDMIYTYYTATLNKNALVSETNNNTQNNPNTAWLNYSNNPNGTGTGTTAKNTVYDWTYTFSAEKVDESNQPLPGAVFKLQDSSGAVIKLVEVEEPNVFGDLVEGAKYYRPAYGNETGTETITTADDCKFIFIGLDDTKTYTLVEDSAPLNYTKAGDTEVEIDNTYTNPGSVLGSIGYEMNGNPDDDGNVVIVNNKGTSLPTTGGIGTTLFYVIGGTLAAGAGVALIAKKRMKNEE